MKSYIYIVITKELFRRSIAGINGAAGGDPTPLPPQPRVPPEWDFVGLRPRASCWGGGCSALSGLGATQKAGRQHGGAVLAEPPSSRC